MNPVSYFVLFKHKSFLMFKIIIYAFRYLFNQLKIFRIFCIMNIVFKFVIDKKSVNYFR